MDVTELTFQAEVIDRSHQLPVVVDFWAEWCGPCRQLAPVLEKAVAERGGTIALAKLDTDANQRIAQAFNIQSIPAVKAFKDGKQHSEFIGVLPPHKIKTFLDGLIPSEVELLVGKGDEASLRKAVELEPSRADAAVPLAQLLNQRGEIDEAQRILANVAGSFAADGLAARIKLEQSGSPDLSDAFASLDRNELQDALDKLLNALPTADGAKDDLRRVIVGILDELGPDSELARSSRRRLASALY